MKFTTTLIILFNFLALHHCPELCDPLYCNLEGQCEIVDNERTCNCIGSKYFEGTRCLEKIDNCIGNPCVNGGICYSLVGQFICRNCNEGFGGLRCDVALPNVFQNMVVLFNHYGYYSVTHKFLLLVEDLGYVPFAVEFVADNYVLDSFECNPPEDKSQWVYSSDLTGVIGNLGIRYYNDLQFDRGFYRLINETFWELDLLTLTLSVYDAETATELLYYQTFDLLIKNTDSMKCVPKLQFPHGSNPLEPLMVDIARFNNFKPLIVQRCQEDSEVMYKWTVFNSIGSTKLHNFGMTKIPLLKVPAYRLWFNYHGAVMSSYSLVLTMVERRGSFTTMTEGRCFILVLPKPVKAIIKGGLHREVAVAQSLLLDGSESRDFAMAAPSRNKLLYRWSCTSVEDVTNSACNTSLSTRDVLLIKPHQLKINASYQYTLIIQSTVNVFVRDEAVQNILAVEHPRLFIHIQCVRNCLRNQFTSDISIHLKVECIHKGGCSKQHSKFEWKVDGTIHGTAQRFVYMPKADDSYMIITAEVWHKGLAGKCSMALAKNEPPVGGRCFVEPQRGVAFQTNFHIHCDDYQDIDVPLSYHYKSDDFTLERINDPDVHFHLPECAKVVVEICDQFEACVETIHPVNVSPMEEPENLKTFLHEGNSNINDLLRNGDRLTSMVLLKSLTPYIKKEAEILEVTASLESLNILTVIEMEQWLSIGEGLLMNLVPLDNRKSIAMLEYFKKLYHGLELIRNDNEMQGVSQKSYEQALQCLGAILGEYAKPWEIIPEVNVRQQQQISTSDPIAEGYRELPEFDILILEKLANWLDPCRVLHKCFQILSSHSSYVYFPTEVATIMEEGKFIMKIHGVEETRQYAYETVHQTVDIELSKDILQSMQIKLLKNSISLQMTSFESNPFWWYPNEQPLSLKVFSFTAFTTNTAVLAESFAFKLSPSELDISSPAQEVLVAISSHLDMPTYFLQLPPNAAINVTIVKADAAIFFEISIGRRPRSFLIRQEKRILTTAVNRDDQPKITYIAALAGMDANNFPLFLSFRVNVVECLHWDWDAQDPQWSSKGCWPKVIDNSTLKLKCECVHLSIFTAKTYEYLPNQDLKGNQLLDSLPFNWNLAIFYTTLLSIFCGFGYYNAYRLKMSKSTLMSSVSDAHCDVEVQIYTGSHWKSGSTANVYFRFISERGPYSVTIYQNPGNPQLVRNSLCKFYISSANIQMPFKLTIHHDQSGRYPSWFCHKIYVVNMQTSHSQVFVINQWISKQPLEVLTSSESQSFRENLLNSYINWFQFQPISGPRRFTDLYCVQRCYVFITQTIVSVCIVACFFGPTTMESYEEERELYDSLNFNITEMVVLPFVCFLSSLAIKFIFTSLLCLR